MLLNSWNTRGRQSDAKAEYAVSKRELVRLEVKDTSESKVSGMREETERKSWFNLCSTAIRRNSLALPVGDT